MIFFSKTVTGLCAQTSVSLSPALPVCRSVALSLCPSVCLSADLSVSASTICLSVCTLGKLSVVSAVFMCRYILSVSSTAPGEGIHSATSLCLVSFPRLKVSSILSITRRRIEVFCCLCAGFVAKHRNDSYFRVTLPPPFPFPFTSSLPCFNDPMFVSSSSSSSECGQTSRLFGFFPSLCLADCSVVQLSCLVITIARSLGCFRRVAQLPSLSLIAGLMAMSIYITDAPPLPLPPLQLTALSENQLMATV